MEYDLQKWLENANNEEYAKRVLLHISEQATRIEQLEQALREIAAYKADEDEMDWADTVLAMNAIARAALEGK